MILELVVTLDKTMKSKKVDVELATQLVNRVQDIVDMIKLEIGNLSENEQTADLRQRFKNAKVKLKDYRRLLREKQDKQEETARKMESKYNSNDDKKKSVHEPGSREELMDHATKILDDDVRRLKEANKNVEQSKDMAIVVLENLNKQREQIERIHSDLFEIEDEVQRGIAITKRIGRSVASNKCLILLVCMAIILIIVIIVFKKT